jgi:outer membrane biosynthesis protein TonB
MTTTVYRIPYRSLELPWTPVPEDRERFRRLLRDIAIGVLLFAIIMPWLPVPEPDVEQIPEVPQRFAKLMLDKPKPPPPPPPVVEEEPEPVEVAEEVKPVEKPVEPEEIAPTPEPARERAAKAGLMAFADSLADLRDNDAVAAVTNQRDLTAGAGETEFNERSLVTARAGKASGGINTAGLSRNTGGSGLEGRGTTRVTSSIAGSGTGTGAAGGSGDGRMAARSREEIELVFDRNKGAIYALYNRALRRDPTLRGKLVLKLTIAPSGEVTHCEVVSSELAEPGFESKLVARVKMFRFEAKDVATVTTTKPIDFFPA